MNRSIWIIIITLLAEVFFLSVVVTPEWIQSSRKTERVAISYLIGKAGVYKIDELSLKFYQKYVVDSGFRRGIINTYTVSDEERMHAHGMERVDYLFRASVEKRIYVFFEALQSMFFRISFMFIIFPFVVPIVIALLIDALVQRRINKEENIAPIPVFYHFAKNSIVNMILAPLLIMLAPVSLGAYLFFAWAFSIPILLWLMISNVQHFKN